MTKPKTILVLAAVSQEALERRGADVDDTQCDTIAEAKRRAKHYLTEDWMHRCETSTRLGYAQVLVNGECLYDYFAK